MNDSPQNSIWGPELWMILHSAAERVGSHVNKRLPQEEERIWYGLLGSLRYSLPCPQCKKHYASYFSSHRLVFGKDALRAWLFHLHQEVNQRTSKEPFLFERVQEQYRTPFHYSKHWHVVQGQMILALRKGWCSREDIQRTARFLEELKRFYDFF